jgi:hypothetical protein
VRLYSRPGNDLTGRFPLIVETLAGLRARSCVLAGGELPKWAEMGNLLGQKRRKVGRLQRQAARCFLVTQEASSVELGTWCWPRVVLIEKRPLTESERSSMNRAVRSVGARRIRRLGRNNWIWRLSDDVAARWR